MELVLAAEMRLIEQRAQDEYGLSPRVLMENAGFSAYQETKRLLGGELTGKRILICAGKGNNGGDSFVLARYLANAGAEVCVALTSYREALKGPALESFNAVAKMADDLSSLWIVECMELDWRRKLLPFSPLDLVVDGLLGTGLRGPLTGRLKEMVQYINSLECPCLALDLPTGINADTGQIQKSDPEEELGECCIQADYTLTFGRPKVGLFCYPAPDFVGQLLVSSIGIPDSLIAKTGLQYLWVEPKMIHKMLPKRPSASHKGSFGHVLTIGGSRGLTGAPSLAALAALRSGCGKSTLAGPEGLNAIFESKLTEVMTLPLPSTEEQGIAVSARELLLSKSTEFEGILIGPGLSVQAETREFLAGFLQAAQGRLILDADALNIVAMEKERYISVLKRYSEPPILTPHPGEMARLMGISTKEVQEYRVEVAKEAAAQWSSVVVLKGANTLIAEPGGRVYVNTTGHSGMATAGTGDVLAGIIAGFLAQGLSPLEAALTGTFFHGLAGERARDAGFNAGMIAGDLLVYLPRALEEYYQLKVGK